MNSTASETLLGENPQEIQYVRMSVFFSDCPNRPSLWPPGVGHSGSQMQGGETGAVRGEMRNYPSHITNQVAELGLHLRSPASLVCPKESAELLVTLQSRSSKDQMW